MDSFVGPKEKTLVLESKLPDVPLLKLSKEVEIIYKQLQPFTFNNISYFQGPSTYKNGVYFGEFKDKCR